MCEEELRDGEVVLCKMLGVGGHEPALADCGAGLARGEILGAFREPECAESRGDGSAGDDDDFVAAAHEHGDLLCEPRKLALIETCPARRGEDAGAEFEDDAFVCGGGHEGGIGSAVRGFVEFGMRCPGGV